MELSSKWRREHLLKVSYYRKCTTFNNFKVYFNLFQNILKYLKQGDIVIGCVNYVNEFGIHMTMNCFDNFKRRDLTHIKLDVSCFLRLRENN